MVKSSKLLQLLKNVKKKTLKTITITLSINLYLDLGNNKETGNLF